MTDLSTGRRFLEVPHGVAPGLDDTVFKYRFLSDKGITWDRLLLHPCVVVVAEASSGKSHELENCHSALREAGTIAFLLKIPDVVRDGLREALDPSDDQAFTTWMSGSQKAILLLDCFEFALQQPGELDRSLKKIRRVLGDAARRTRYVFACHAGSFQQLYNEALTALKEHLKPEGVDTGAGEEQSIPPIKVFYLAPLDEAQVRQLAGKFGVSDPDAFLSSIRKANAQVFAQRPDDVRWLTALWIEGNGNLPPLRELHEKNVVRRLSESSDRLSSISLERAREGASRIATACLLTNVFPITTYRAHDAFVKPAEVLSDWTDVERQQLFQLALFDGSLPGLLRFYDWSVAEYLAATWLREMPGIRLSYRKLRRIIFCRPEDEWRLRPHLEGVAAWLALWNDALREDIIRISPSTMISQGDPSGLSADARRAVIRAFAESYAGRERVFSDIDRAGLMRFSATNLEGVVAELLQDDRSSQELKRTLLSIGTFAGMSSLVPLALELALNRERSGRAQLNAVELVANVGGDEQRSALLSLIDPALPPDFDVAGGLIKWLYPAPLGINQLIDLLGVIGRPPQNLFTLLHGVLSYELPATLDQGQRVELLAGLLDFISPVEHRDSGNRVAGGRSWLLSPLARLLVAIIDEEPDAVTQTGAVADALQLFEWCHEHYYQVWSGVDEIRDLAARHQELRRELFWKRVESQSVETGKRPTHYYELRDAYRLYELRSEDLDWLAHDATTRPEVHDRLIAFDTLAWVARTTPAEDGWAERVAVIAQKDNALNKRWQRMLNPREVPSAKMLRWERMRQVHGKRERKRKEQTREALMSRIERIRRGEDLRALDYLLIEARLDPTSRSTLSIDPLREKYGDKIAEAALQGWKAVWRSYDPQLPHERESRNTTPVRVMAGLAGLGMEMRAGLDLSRLSEEEIVRAIRYAACELNCFPDWLDNLASIYPTLVQNTLGQAIEADYRYSDQSQTILDVLAKLPRANSTVQLACCPVIKSLLEDGDPPLAEALQQSLGTLFRVDALSQSEITAIATTRLGTLQHDDRRFVIWVVAWINSDPSAAFEFLTQWLHDHDSEQSRGLVERLASEMYEMNEHQSWMELCIRQDVGALERLIPILFSHIRREEDIDHEGVYSPGSRDNAQMFRDFSVRWLKAINTPEAAAALTRLAEDGAFADVRDWLLHLAEEAVEGSAPCSPLAVDEASAWIRQQRAEVSSTTALHDLALEHLEDIKYDIEAGDFSVRHLFTLDGVNEIDFQKWLARELRQRSLHVFTVHREEEVDRNKKPDIRLHRPGLEGPVSIEVKVANKWTLPELLNALEEQLVGRYLRAVESRHGIMILCYRKEKRWNPETGTVLSFNEVVAQLRERAQFLVRNNTSIERLDVMTIDFVALSGCSERADQEGDP